MRLILHYSLVNVQPIVSSPLLGQPQQLRSDRKIVFTDRRLRDLVTADEEFWFGLTCVCPGAFGTPLLAVLLQPRRELECYPKVPLVRSP